MKKHFLEGKTVAALVSGGLDSTTIIKWLSLRGAKILAITADLGQPDENDLNDVARRMKEAGAIEAIIVDAKGTLARYMLQVIHELGHHEGGYMNTTGIARMVTVAVSMDEIHERIIKYITHGATGRGNDQVRFENAVTTLSPSIKVYAPWRDNDFVSELGGRKQMIDFCKKHKLQISATRERPYSTDANFCGLTHEAGKLEYLSTPTDFVNFLMVTHPQKVKRKQEYISIRFEKGVPIQINDSKKGLVDVFMLLNEIAGRNGIGITDVVENRRVGIKSRGVYESPGVTLLEKAYAKMLELILDRNRRKFFDIVSRQFADLVYEGEWFSPLGGDLLAVINNVAGLVTGEVTFKLYRGNVFFVEIRDVVHGLYDPERASMEKVGEFNHTDSQGYLNIANVLTRALHYAGQTRRP